MNRRYVLAGLGLIGAIALVSTALAGPGGGGSAKAPAAKAAKKKRGPRGPAGPPGPAGPQGTQGPPGTQGLQGDQGPAGIAKAIVHWGDSDGGQASVVLVGADTTTGVTVTRCQTNGGGTAGQYLINLPASITPHNVEVTPEPSGSSDPAGPAWTARATVTGGVGSCGGGDILVSLGDAGVARAGGAYVLVN